MNAVDFALWRYHDLLQTCALSAGRDGDADYSFVGQWSDGTDIVHATVVHERPMDVGLYPSILLAECDAGQGPTLYQERIQLCPPTNVAGRSVRPM